MEFMIFFGILHTDTAGHFTRLSTKMMAFIIPITTAILLIPSPKPKPKTAIPTHAKDCGCGLHISHLDLGAPVCNDWSTLQFLKSRPTSARTFSRMTRKGRSERPS
jgi:hypothetical protein